MTIDYLNDDERKVGEAAAAAALEEYRAERAAIAERQDRVEHIRDALAGSSDRVLAYSANQDTDLTEGKAGVVSMGHFFLREDAEEASSWLEGVFGHENTNKPTEIQIFTNFPAWLEISRVNGTRLREPS